MTKRSADTENWLQEPACRSAQQIIELSPEDIDPSSVTDRLPRDAMDEAAFVETIRMAGQQAPILVRRHPDKAERYQIIYGRRRMRAAAELGRPVKAIVRSMDDREAVIAQGLENVARADLSFIERALFASAIEARGFDRETILSAVGADKSELSRYLTIVHRVPRDLIEAIGSAPAIGRPRWSNFAQRLETPEALSKVRSAAAEPAFPTKPSDLRFMKLFQAAAPARETGAPITVAAEDGQQIAVIRNGKSSAVITINLRHAPGFPDFVGGRLASLYAEWLKDQRTSDRLTPSGRPRRSRRSPFS